LAQTLPDFQFIPALSDAAPEDAWTGETGFIHEVVRAHLPDMGDAAEIDVYSCGPPPMIDALLPVLQIAGVEPERIFFDKFTPALR
jgi:propane monooxygenase reductase subunit